MIRLGVNIDHVATIRNARGEFHPDPYKAALYAMKCGADSITIHLREDRRHIKDKDFKKISSNKKIPLNLEMATDLKILRIALNNKPNFVCFVPEKRNKKKIKKILSVFNKHKVRTSLFINPSLKDVEMSKKLNAKCIEIHTGKISNLIKNNKNYKNELKKINNVVKYAVKLDLEVHAGHGMDYKTAKVLSKISGIKEFNIGHFIIGESIFFGLKKTIKA